MPIRLVLVLPFLLLAMAELAILVSVGGSLGVLPTFMLLLGVSILGMALAQRQGLAMLGRMRTALQRGQVPMAEAFDGIAILAAGILLVLPGFLTDIVAILLLLPIVRRLLYKALAGRQPVKDAAWPHKGREPDVIEGEFEEIGPPVARPERRGPA